MPASTSPSASIRSSPSTPPARRVHTGERPTSLTRGGLPVVLSQTFRALIQSRMKVGMASYERRYPRTDMLVLEPDRGDAELFFQNVFSYADRKRLSEHAYRCTRRDLRARAGTLAPMLRRHGLRLRRDVLDDRSASFEGAVRERARRLQPLTGPLAPGTRPARVRSSRRAPRVRLRAAASGGPSRRRVEAGRLARAADAQCRTARRVPRRSCAGAAHAGPADLAVETAAAYAHGLARRSALPGGRRLLRRRAVWRRRSTGPRPRPAQGRSG